MSKREEFNDFFKESLKSKDKTAVATIRLIMAALKDRDIAARSKGQTDGVSDDEILSMLQTMVKQRRESAATYNDAGREELAEREETEISVIERFLPQQLSEDDLKTVIEKIIAETGAETIRDMGKAMGALKNQYAGQVDMGKAGALIKAKLG